MIQLLAIGNSFTEDALYYLHGILQAKGVESRIVNLYIGGCSLEQHWSHIEQNAKAYQYQLNGKAIREEVSIEEVLQETDWNHIVTQQASHDSGWMDSYEPFLPLTKKYIMEQKPGAKLWLNETWAYEPDSCHDKFARYNRSQEEMFSRLRNCYHTMAEKYDLPLIPTGELIQELRNTVYFSREQNENTENNKNTENDKNTENNKNTEQNENTENNETAQNKEVICRDGFHLHYLYGRYAAACLFAKTIFGIKAPAPGYIPESEEWMPGVKPKQELLDCINEIAFSIQ